MTRRFLEWAVRALGERGAAMGQNAWEGASDAGDRTAGASGSSPPDEPADGIPDEQHARAMARRILRRAGIAPLLSAAALLWIGMPQPVRSEGQGPVHAAATARAVVLPSSVELRAGRLVVQGRAASAREPARPVERACETPRAGESEREDGRLPPPCRMLVYDLP